MVKACLAASLALACAAGAAAFHAPVALRPTAGVRSRTGTSWVTPRMVVEDKPVETVVPPSEAAPSKGLAIVPVNPENVEFSAGVVGALTGFLVGGPFFAAVLGVAGNFASKKENEAGVAVRGIGKTAIEAYNFLLDINSKYDVAGKAGTAVDSAVSKLKEQGDAEAIDNVTKTLNEAKAKAAKLTEEYDLLAKGKQALGVVGELADTAIEKGMELEKEYEITGKVKDAATKAIDSAKEANK